MTRSLVIKPKHYCDSVRLMEISARLQKLPHVETAAVVLGTPYNLALLAEQNYRDSGLASAGPTDLVIAVGHGPELTVDAIVAEVDRLLAEHAADDRDDAAERAPRSLRQALARDPQANLVLISLPGEYAAREARSALSAGCHVMIFSDNVSLDDEIQLKQLAVARQRLMMGPDCGTAIIGGKPLGFANVVRRGPIGVLGASGTGIQEITCCIHKLGGGVSQAIGTGGRDLHREVGGTMTRLAIQMLAADVATDALVVVSKPPAAEVADRVIAELAACPKPSVVHFVGSAPSTHAVPPHVHFADSLAGAAELACGLTGVSPVPTGEPSAAGAPAPVRLAKGTQLCGLFCGGTTGCEALSLLTREGHAVTSNMHLVHHDAMSTPGSPQHQVLDLGDDQFTRGRPHPMIEPALRNERLLHEVADPAVGLLLFDLLLGYGSHADPAGVLARGVEHARARAAGRELVFVASITGTPNDPQDYHQQRQTLDGAGILVAPNNREAARLVCRLLAEAN